MSERNHWRTRKSSRRLSRRSLLRASARAGVGAAGLAPLGCGDGDTLTSDSVRLRVERGKNLDGSNVKTDLAAIGAVVAVDDLTANFEMNAHFSPLLRVLDDRAGMITAPSSHERINETNSREVPVGTDAFAYVDEDLDGPYTQE